MKTLSLTKTLIGSHYLGSGLLAHGDGMLSQGYRVDPLPSGTLEEDFLGSNSDHLFTKLSDLLTKLPNLFEGQILLNRAYKDPASPSALLTQIFFFEKVNRAPAYSHLQALFSEMGLTPVPLSAEDWDLVLSGLIGESNERGVAPDLIWDKECVKSQSQTIRVLSLTELPKLTWKGCFQPIFENEREFTFSLHVIIPERGKVKRMLQTKRRVSHALSVTSSLEVRNIESNSVLTSSEETLERILVHKETLFEISVGLILKGSAEETLEGAKNIERLVSGIGSAGFFLEGIGTLPVLRSHIPGNKLLSIRKLPVLSENLAHLVPLLLDYSRLNEGSSLNLRSRSEEASHLNLFSKENLNFNSFICGASGSGKSFLMNAILFANLKDDQSCRLCIFDVGGSYRKIIESNGGMSTRLTAPEAKALISSFLGLYPVGSESFYRALIETLCGSGPHITHSHRVAIDDLLKELEGERLNIKKLITNASKRSERFYGDLAHWLKPHVGLDQMPERGDLIALIRTQVSAFDFKELDSDPVLQKTTILLLTELLWRDLVDGKFKRTLIVFDEVWRFFAQSKTFLEEMYRTLRKYRAGIVSITQNLADYGDEAFAKMLFTNSFTKLFLQNGASAEYLRNTFDLPESDISRALSVSSKKPLYSEFFALTPSMSQVFRLYPTEDFYALAHTENISNLPEKLKEASL